VPASRRVPGHRRDPDAHRAAILAAAGEVFAERGYSGATVRQIAARAGVTHGSVMRHFASKEKLFVAAVPGARDLPGVVADGERATLAARIAAAWVTRMESAHGADQMTTLVRSAADRDTALRLYNAMTEGSVRAYRSVLAGPDADLRIELLAAHFVGVTFTRYVLRVGPLATLPADELIVRLTDTINHILFAAR
jgi:AcrR family transcriptional regulator